MFSQPRAEVRGYGSTNFVKGSFYSNSHDLQVVAVRATPHPHGLQPIDVEIPVETDNV